MRLAKPAKKVVSNLVLAALFGCSMLTQTSPAANAATSEETVEVAGRTELEQAVADAQNFGIAIDVQRKTTKVSAAEAETEQQRIAEANQRQEANLRQLIAERQNQRSEAVKRSLQTAFPRGLSGDVTEMDVNYATVSLISFKRDARGIANQQEEHYITEGDSFVYPAVMVNPTTGRKIDVTFTAKAIYNSPEVDETKRLTKGRLCGGGYLPDCNPGAGGKELYLEGEFGVFFGENVTSTWEISFNDSETKEPVKLNSLLSIEDVDFNQKVTTPSSAKTCLQGNKLSREAGAGCGVIGDPGLYVHGDQDHVNHESTVLMNVEGESSYEMTFHVGDTTVAGVVFFLANKGLNYTEPEFDSTEVIYEDLIVEHSSEVPSDYPTYELPEGKISPEATPVNTPKALPNTGV